MAQARTAKIGSVSDEGKREAVHTSERVLKGIRAIAERARAELAKGMPGTQLGFAANAASKHLGILEQNRRNTLAVSKEPAIARVHVRWQDSGLEECFFMTRGSAAGLGPSDLDGKLVSYKTPLGRLAEFGAGDDAVILTPMGRRECQVLNRALISPLQVGGEWDARNNVLETLTSVLRPVSLLDLIEQWKRAGIAVPSEVVDYLSLLEEAGAGAESLLLERQRETVDKMALRDQAVLDQYQGAVFRMPLDSQLVLFGAPGTGKTTTLIKRLAQKRSRENLTSEETELLEERGLEGLFDEDTSWVMYSPTELLKLYVKEAFNREGVPASSQNIKTWENQRHALGKETLRILKSATDGTGFQYAADGEVLASTDSSALMNFHDRFAAYADQLYLTRFREAAKWLREDETPMAASVRTSLSRLDLDKLTIAGIYEFSARNEELRQLGRRLADSNRSLQANVFNRLVAPTPNERLGSLGDLLAKKGSAIPVAAIEEEDGLDGESAPMPKVDATKATIDELMRLIGRWAEAQVDGRSTKNLRDFEEWMGDRAPEATELKGLGQQIILRRKLQVLETTPRAAVFGVPATYRRYRREQQGVKGLFAEGAKSLIDAGQISPDELDVLILVMLRNARRAAAFSAFPWLEEIAAQYRLQVYVDEATDFSAVQLACMLELSHPKARSWFACGDFRQRITRHGITSEKDLEWIQETVGLRKRIETESISAVYRQGPRLTEFAAAFEAKKVPSVSNAHAKEPAPLLLERAGWVDTATWLAERIVEVERTVKRLPSVAIFVDGEEHIDRLMQALQPELAKHNLPVVACRDGHAIGDTQQVRVFDVRHVKGLEFEAVFFIRVDELENRMSKLFDRFLYVGITRAATFLGITCRAALPESMNYLRPLLSDGNWSV